MHKVVISGTGRCLPDKVITNHDLAKIVDTSDEWIVQRTGIRERHFISGEETTTTTSVKAGFQALEAANLTADQLDGIILCSVTPDTFVPAGSCHIHRDLKAVNATAFDVNAACTGWTYGAMLAKSMIESGQWKHAMVVGAESLSRILNMEDRTTCILFGDGAGATLLSRADLVDTPEGSGFIDVGSGTDGEGWNLILQPAGGAAMPASEQTVSEKLHTLTMKGRDVYKFAVKKMTELVNTCIERNNISIDDISLFVPHQVNIRILEAVFDNLKLPLDRCMVNLDKYGNTSAASVPIALDEAVRTGRIQRGDLIFCTAFGSGLTWGWNLFRY